MSQKNFDPGPKSKVEWHRSGSRSTLIFVKTLKHPPEKVWEALTDPDQLRQWAPYVVDRNLSRTGTTKLTMIDGMKSEEFTSTVHRAVRPKNSQCAGHSAAGRLQGEAAL